MSKIKILIYFFFSATFSCNTSKNIKHVDCQKKFKILDSISYISFPDDNWGTTGNSVFKKILEKGESIKPCLIEKILDTTKSNLRIADSYNYKNGDIAVLMLPYVSKTKISLRNLLFEEFKNELKGKNRDNDFFSSIYYFLLFSNNEQTNYNNRLRLYKKLNSSNLRKPTLFTFSP